MLAPSEVYVISIVNSIIYFKQIGKHDGTMVCQKNIEFESQPPGREACHRATLVF